MPHKTDLLLINPNSRQQAYQALGSQLAAVETPVWLALIAAFVRQKGFSVAVIDSEAEALTFDEINERLQHYQPRLTTIVVYGHNPSASTQVMAGASLLCSAIKSKFPEQKILMVGGHVAALPKLTLEEENCDFVAGGEGFYTISDLLEALKKDQSDLRKVRGLYYRDKNQLIENPAAPLVMDLDREVPGAAWDLLPMQKYRAHNWHCFGFGERTPYAALYTTLGCPYHCSFCCIQAPFKQGEKAAGYKDATNSYRSWSIESTMKQIDLLVNQYHVKNIKIADEMFVLNTKYVSDFCDALIKKNHDLNLWGYARVDTIKEPGLLPKLKKAGFRWLAFGIEAANPKVREAVKKGFDQKLIFDTIRKVQAEGIYVIANYIFGLPEDDLKSMQSTLDLALELNTEFANFYCTMAYPGSELYEEAQKNHWALPKTWSAYSQLSEDSFPLATKYLTSADVLRFRDQAFQQYFNHPHYLNRIRKVFGVDGEKQIRQMTAQSIKRTGISVATTLSN